MLYIKIANIRTAISVSYADYLVNGRTDEAKYIYNIVLEKLFDEEHDEYSGNWATSIEPLANKSHKTGLYAGICVVIWISYKKAKHLSMTFSLFQN